MTYCRARRKARQSSHRIIALEVLGAQCNKISSSKSCRFESSLLVPSFVSSMRVKRARIR